MPRNTGAGSNKRRERSKKWNDSNHTHFKQLYKTSSSNRAKHTAHPMTVGQPTKTTMNHRRYQLNLLLHTIGGKTWTIMDIMKEIKEKNLVVLYHGANGVTSMAVHKYIASLLATLLNEHKLVRVYEHTGKGKARWRYIPNTNIVNRVLIELYNDSIIQSVRNYCTRCVVSLKSMI